MNRRAPAIAAVVGVAVLALVVVLVISPSERQQSDPGRELIGNVAPALTGTTLTGDRFDIDEHRGQWVLVNFFATWCPPCVEEHPELVAFSERNRGEVQVVSVAYDSHELDRVRKFFAEKGGDWPVITGGADGATIEYRVKGVPESFLVDPSGTVVTKYNGGVTAEELEAAMAAASGEGVPGGGGT
ncbi:MAG TPA: TlpA disulfide reductase family protein [Microthrixaceae bacterium]|nr:TlpA disulfide reductase family protein [Microthrixaceae bacterium]